MNPPYFVVCRYRNGQSEYWQDGRWIRDHHNACQWRNRLDADDVAARTDGQVVRIFEEVLSE